MPIHEYKCKNCGATYDVFYRSFSAVEKEEPLEQCPKCESTEKEKQINTSTSHILKGFGWAKDGYG